MIWSRDEQRWRLWDTLRRNHTGTASGVHEFLTQAFTLLITEHRTGLVLAHAEFLATTFLLCVDGPSSLSIHSDAQRIPDDGLWSVVRSISVVMTSLLI